MSLPTPKLDDRTFEQIQKDLIARIPALCPQWTDYNPSDPGITLLELMSWMAELLLYRINRIPEKSFVRFLELIGTELRGPSRAHTWAVFSTTDEKNAGFVRKETSLATVSGPEGPIYFRTSKDLNLTAAKLVKIRSSSRELTPQLSVPEAKGEPILERPHNDHILYLGDRRLADCRRGTIIYVDIALERAMTGAVETEWEVRDGDSWITFIPAADETQALRSRGRLQFIATGAFAETKVSEIAAQWLRLRLVNALEGGTEQIQMPLISRINLALERPVGQTELPTKMYLSEIISAKDREKLKDIPTVRDDRWPLKVIDPNSEIVPFGNVPQRGNTFYVLSPLIGRENANIIIEIGMPEGYSQVGVEADNLQLLRLRWEYFSRDGTWKTLGILGLRGTIESLHDFQDHTNAFTQPGFISFRKPDDLAPATILTETQFSIRCVLSSGDYGGEAGRPPKLQPIGIRFAEIPMPVEHCIAQNGPALSILTANLRAGRLEPFDLSVDCPEISLAFDRAMANLTQTLLFVVAESRPIGRPSLIWEYSDDPGWRPLTVVQDGTGSLSRTGVLEFIAPPDWRAIKLDDQSLFWLRGRLPIAHYTDPPRLRGVHLNATDAVQERRIKDEVIGSSTGEPDQVFTLRHEPVIMTPEIHVREPNPADQLRLEWVSWEVVDSFLESTDNSRHCVLDRRLGTITFGDNRRGMIPPVLNDNIRASYAVGGGSRGNVGTGAISSIDLSHISVTNVTPAIGGADGETVEEAEMRGPWLLKHRYRAVTCEDYAHLAYEATSEVARTFCFAEDNGVHLLVIPKGGAQKPRPSGQLVRHLTKYLDERRIVTTRLRISGPDYQDIQLKVELALHTLDVESFRSVRAECERRLQMFVDPLNGGPEKKGWPLGRTFYASEVYHLLTQLPEIDYVKSVGLRRTGETQWHESILVEQKTYPALDLHNSYITQV